MKNEKKTKLHFFEKKVMDFYRKAGRETLPWRKEGITAYEVWVSEIMLQQTQVSRVIEYYTKFLKRFPTVSQLAVTSWEEFLPYYAGLGYYRRGRNMILTAQKVMDEFGGEFPRDKKLLMTLPGVGDYTASAILSFAYGENYLAWDTNLKRVTGRFFCGSKKVLAPSPAGEGRGEEYDLPPRPLGEGWGEGRKFPHPPYGHLLPRGGGGFISSDLRVWGFDIRFKTHAKELNAALMDFGSAICTGNPKCKICPLASKCVYFSEEGKQEQPAFAKVTTDKVNWKEAQVFLWLHQDHRLYYSSHPKRFEIFVLPAEYNSRAGIKAYFKEKYALDLAVRPPHKKIVVAGKPTFFVNAQILLGHCRFVTFSKEEIKRYNENIV